MFVSRTTRFLAPVVILLSLCAVLSVGVPPARSLLQPYADVVRGSTPTAYWRLDEQSGTTAIDATGNGNNGTYQNVDLGGESGVESDDDASTHFRDGSLVDLRYRFLFPGRAAFSLEAWVMQDPGAMGHIFSTWNYASGLQGYWLNADQDGYLEFSRYNGATGDVLRLNSPMTPDEWHHVVATYDGWHMAIYVDGALKSSMSSFVSISTNTGPFYIGYRGIIGSSWHGSIDEAAVYERALSATEISDHYDAGVSYSTERDVPTLTSAERTNAIAIATSDPRFTAVMAGHAYTVTSATPWLKLADNSKLGAQVVVTLSTPATLEYDWPLIDYDESETTSPPYTETIGHWVSTNTRSAEILIDFARAKMVSMEPVGDDPTSDGAFAARATTTYDPAVTGDVAGSTLKLRRVYTGSDWFWNFDFTTTSVVPGSVASRSNVDWPIGLIFWNNATVNKAKDNLGWSRGCTYTAPDCALNHTASPMNSRVHDGLGTSDPRGTGIFHGTTWDDDRGAVKGAVCFPWAVKRHYRIYAPAPSVGGDDRMYNLTWGYYVVGSAHKDVREGCIGAWSGNSEETEGLIANDAREVGWVVAEDAIQMYNAQDARPQGRKHFQNDGRATTLKIP